MNSNVMVVDTTLQRSRKFVAIKPCLGKMEMQWIEENININTWQTNEKLDKLIQGLNQVKRENADFMKQVADQFV